MPCADVNDHQRSQALQKSQEQGTILAELGASGMHWLHEDSSQDFSADTSTPIYQGNLTTRGTGGHNGDLVSRSAAIPCHFGLINGHLFTSTMWYRGQCLAPDNTVWLVHHKTCLKFSTPHSPALYSFTYIFPLFLSANPSVNVFWVINVSNTRPEFSWAISGLNKARETHFRFNSELRLICCFAELYPEIQRASYACKLFIYFTYQTFLFFSTFHHIQDAICSLPQFAYCPSASLIIDQDNICFLLLSRETRWFLQDCAIPQALQKCSSLTESHHVPPTATQGTTENV